MPIIYDRLYDKLKYIPARALYNGGYYQDLLNGTPNYLTADSSDRNYYIDPITGRLEYKPVVWTPGEEPSSFTAWYDPTESSTITETATQVSQWGDKLGASAPFTQSTGAQQPFTGVRQVNNLNVINLAGTGWLRNDGLAAAIGSDNPEVSFFFVGITDVVSPCGHLTLTDTASNWPALGSITTQSNLDSVIFRNAVATSPNPGDLHIYTRPLGTPPAGTPVLRTIIAGTPNAEIRYNGLQTASGTRVVNLPQPLTKLSLGALERVGIAAFWQGAIGEILIIVGTPPSADLARRIEGYLAWRWGIPIDDPTHPYVSNPPFV